MELASPQDVARFFVYMEKLKTSKGRPSVRYKNISAKTVYAKNKTVFDKLFDVSGKYRIDMKRYIGFFVFELGKTREDLLQEFLSKETLSKYSMCLKIIANQRKIYGFLMKSAMNIARECEALGLDDCRKYIKRLVEENMLGEKLLSGEISQYYLASIRNIDKLVGKMRGGPERDELDRLVARKDKLALDAKTAFENSTKENFKPLALANKLLMSRKKASPTDRGTPETA